MIRTSAGSTIAISAAAPATFDVAGYDLVAFTQIGEVTDLGEYGREYALVTHNPIDNRGTQKRKGSFNEGTMNLTLGLDEDDAGQILAESAADSDDSHSIKITLQSGAIHYFQAQVMSFKIGVGNVDQITAATIALELTTAADGTGIVKKAAP